MARKYSIDQDCFASIRQENQAYCLGFLIADGWVHTGGRGITVAVSECDVDVLDYIKSCCSSNAPHFIKKRNGGHNSGGVLVGVSLCSIKMVADLALLGLTKNKAASSVVPLIDEKLVRHFLRGLFDGDGSIGQRQFWLVGSETLLFDVVRIGRRIGAKLQVGTSNGYPRLWGNRPDAVFLHWLYDKCDFALDRKRAAVEEYW